MKRILKSIATCCLAATMTFSAISCASNEKKTALDPKKPVTVTVWNYYNGVQQESFENAVDKFNQTTGADKGIIIVSSSLGDVGTLADSLIDSVDAKAGAKETPNLAAVYSETAYLLDEKNALASFDDYFTKDELKSYVDGFIEEGRFNSKNDLMLFPISKSTEVFAANTTDWAKFAKATGVTLDSIKTKEDLVAAAKKYYEWTDSLTPNVKDDGKALYGRDSSANYIYLGCYQLGHEIVNIKNGKSTLDIDKNTFKTLWDNYYIPFVNGYFGSYANFRSEDAKTGKILALTSSSSGVSYLSTEVIDSDNSKHSIELQISKSLPFKNTVNDAVVQQGAGYCMLKGTEAQQEGAVEFLKWFTQTDRNMEFSLSSGYSPVKVDANSKEAIKKSYTAEISDAGNKMMLDSLLVSADEFSNSTAYAAKPFEQSKDLRTLIGDEIDNITKTDREAVVNAIKSGSTHEQAVSKYISDEYFNTWFDSFKQKVETLVK